MPPHFHEQLHHSKTQAQHTEAAQHAIDRLTVVVAIEDSGNAIVRLLSVLICIDDCAQAKAVFFLGDVMLRAPPETAAAVVGSGTAAIMSSITIGIDVGL